MPFRYSWFTWHRVALQVFELDVASEGIIRTFDMAGTDMGPIPPNEPSALDFDLPDELIQDAMGRIFCIVCKVYVPRGQMNASQHLSGKKHASCAKLLPAEMRAARREELIRHVEEQKTAGGDMAARPLTATSTCAGSAPGQLNATAQQAAAPGLRAEPPASEVERKVVAPSSTGDDSEGHEGQIRAQVRRNEIDKDKFLSSILEENESEDDSLESVEEALGRNSGATFAEASATVQGRSTAFVPIKYKAPADIIDIFSDEFVDEMPASDKAQMLKQILAKNTNAYVEAPATAAAKRVQRSGVDFISLEPVVNDMVSPQIAANTPADDSPSKERERSKEEVESQPDDSEDSDDDKQDPSSLLPPWLIGGDSIEVVKYNTDASLALHFEIIEFARFISPTRAEVEVRQNLVRTITSIVQTLWPQSRVEVFGSYATDLYLPTSDIDICVMDTPEGGGQAPDFTEHLELAQAIRNVKEFARRVNFIKARVPLVKIVARTSNVQCDISFNRKNGPDNVPVIQKYLTDYPAVRPLLMVLKCFLQQRSLNEVFSGGLGSYSVLLLVVSHLQTLSYNFPGSNANLGTALQNFFYLYGRLFNYCLVGIGVKGGGCYYDKVEKYQTAPNDTLRYSIEDPNDETNELGRNSYAASRIRKAFGNAFVFLSKWRRDDQTGPVTPLSSILHIDDLSRERRSGVEEDLLARGLSSLQSSILASLSVEAPGLSRRAPVVDAAACTATGASATTTRLGDSGLMDGSRAGAVGTPTGTQPEAVQRGLRSTDGVYSHSYDRSTTPRGRTPKRYRTLSNLDESAQQGMRRDYSQHAPFTNGENFTGINGPEDNSVGLHQVGVTADYTNAHTRQMQMMHLQGDPYNGPGFVTGVRGQWDPAVQQQLLLEQGQRLQQQHVLQLQQNQMLMQQQQYPAPMAPPNEIVAGSGVASLEARGQRWRAQQPQLAGGNGPRGRSINRGAWGGSGGARPSRGRGRGGGTGSRGGRFHAVGRENRPRQRG
jgi:DNA polymerase sigma